MKTFTRLFLALALMLAVVASTTACVEVGKTGPEDEAPLVDIGGDDDDSD